MKSYQLISRHPNVSYYANKFFTVCLLYKKLIKHCEDCTVLLFYCLSKKPATRQCCLNYPQSIDKINITFPFIVKNDLPPTHLLTTSANFPCLTYSLQELAPLVHWLCQIRDIGLDQTISMMISRMGSIT